MDNLPFLGSSKQFYEGIRDGDWKKATLGGVFLIVDVFTAGEGGEGLKLAEEGVEGLAKLSEITAEDEFKEGAEKALEDVAVHGNSAEATGAQHAYDIEDTRTGKVVKTGVSGGKETAGGLSVRAEKQVRALNKANPGRFKSAITHRIPAGSGARRSILDYERARATALRAAGHLRDINLHVRP